MPAPKAPVCNLSAQLDLLAADLCRRIPELAHIDPTRVLFCLSRSRADGTHGVYARIVPMRFAAGKAEYTRRRGRYLETFRLPELVHGGRNILYIVTLMLPRFLRLSATEKLHTVIHELYHVSPACDGDIRRFSGRNYAHGASRKAFDAFVARLVQSYLQSSPPPALPDFLHLDEASWREGRCRILGLKIPLPRARLVAREKI